MNAMKKSWIRSSPLARFMELGGSITGWRSDLRWLKLPGPRPAESGSVLGYRFIGRNGLRIASTVVSSSALQRHGGAHAPAGAGR
jgi:hypothetical protein